jgi:hypothetical protein
VAAHAPMTTTTRTRCFLLASLGESTPRIT